MTSQRSNTVFSLDTNIILRLLLEDQPVQLALIMQLLDTAKPASLPIADVVFFEAVWILSGDYYQFTRQQVTAMLLQISDLPQVHCNRALLRLAMPRYVKHGSISFIDACLTAYAELNGALPLVTFDTKLVTAVPKLVTSL